MDFTLSTYSRLLKALQKSGYSFQTFVGFIQNPKSKTVILRHDVDRLPGNALRMAKIEHGMGIAASYYFRVVPVSFDLGVMEEIVGMGHEIGYHYENIDSVIKEGKRRRKHFAHESSRIFTNQEKNMYPADRRAHSFIAKGVKDKRRDERERLIDLGYEDFCRNLERFRERFEVRTICMHGSPLSRYDNRMIWEKYDYRELGIIGEPYFDVDYKKVFYITDTGRSWNHESARVRDRVESGFDIEVRSTGHLIELIKKRDEQSFVHESARIGANEERNISAVHPGETPQRGPRFHWAGHSGNGFTACGESKGLPDKIMINVHPQRWHDRAWPWVKELVGQRVKNVVKAALISKREPDGQ